MRSTAERLFEEASRLSRAEPRDRLLEVLEEALELPEEERKALVLRLRDEKKKSRPSSRAVVSWDSIRRARGVVQLGGDAVEDCDRLYDG